MKNIYKLSYNDFGDAFIIASNYSEAEQLFKDKLSYAIKESSTCKDFLQVQNEGGIKR